MYRRTLWVINVHVWCNEMITDRTNLIVIIIAEIVVCVFLFDYTVFWLKEPTATIFKNCFVSVRLLPVLRGHSFFSFPPQRPMTSDFKGFPISDFIKYNYCSILRERARVFPFECSVLNKDTTGTIYITSLVWCGPWLGIEPGTTRDNDTRQVYKLVQRSHWYGVVDIWLIYNEYTICSYKRVYKQMYSHKSVYIYLLNLVVLHSSMSDQLLCVCWG